MVCDDWSAVCSRHGGNPIKKDKYLESYVNLKRGSRGKGCELWRVPRVRVSLMVGGEASMLRSLPCFLEWRWRFDHSLIISLPSNKPSSSSPPFQASCHDHDVDSLVRLEGTSTRSSRSCPDPWSRKAKPVSFQFHAHLTAWRRTERFVQ